MKKTRLSLMLFMITMSLQVFGQNAETRNSADKAIRSSGRVNPSTLGMEINLPLASYPTRGINLPIGLSYSSKVWRFQHESTIAMNPAQTYVYGIYSDDAAAGWTSSLAQPYIAYTGMSDRFDEYGRPAEGGTGDYYVPRITVFLPGGSSHELRLSDSPLAMPSPAPTPPWAWNGTFKSSDGSGIKYVEDNTVTPKVYRLFLSDGSFYDLDAQPEGRAWGAPSIRKAIKLTDVNGNFLQFNGPNTQSIEDPYGSWTDQLGRTFPVMIPLTTPNFPNTQNTLTDHFTLPGMGAPYVLNWKRLGAVFAKTSYELHYIGTADGGLPTNSPELFSSNLSVASECDPYHKLYVRSFNLENYTEEGDPEKFNPMVLSDIELPNGSVYQFKYNEHGEIETLIHPTGGYEKFSYDDVESLAGLPPGYQQANRGVTESKIYENSSDYISDLHFLRSEYSADVSDNNYKTTIIAPDNTQTDNFMHRGIKPQCDQHPTPEEYYYGGLKWGYDSPLAGKIYETRVFSSGTPRRIVQRTLTKWETSPASPTVAVQWATNLQLNARVHSTQSITYDGNVGVSAITKLEYDTDKNNPGSPLNVVATREYAYVPVSGGDGILPTEAPQYGVVTIPDPTTQLTPIRSQESTYLINDSNYTTTYQDQNILRRVTVTKVKQGSGTGPVLSQSEVVYDEAGRSPGARGNPTTSKSWDSVKGVVTNSSAYIATHARFDSYGNQYESTDALGNTTTTTFDGTYHAFPIQVTSPIPDQSSGTYGSTSAFVTTATFNTITGLPLTTTDANGLKTAIEYDSATLRPRFSRYYNGSTQVGGTNETIYHDVSGDTWVGSKIQIDDSHYAESKTYLDGLGRSWKTEKADSGGNVFAVKEFDDEGRVERVSNPYRLTGDPCYSSGAILCWTTNTYDAVSRVIQVEQPDGSSILTAYGVSNSGAIGITKTITDQAGKKRKGYTDALGNMVRVIEDPNSSALATDYTFDLLGNIRQTAQGTGQYRYFYHSSLGRLLYAKQVEQDANTNFSGSGYTDPVTSNNQWSVKYQYDDNGNIFSTTDANNITVAASYDHLNRIYLRNYSDSTPDVEFFYDGKGLESEDIELTYMKGKTTKVKSTASETMYLSFDVFGRLLTHRQVTGGTNYDTAYAYNLTGALIEQTYPSGRKVKNTFDENGDLSQVQSKKNAASGYWQYAGSLSRDASGNVTKMQLGNGRWETSSFNNRGQVKQIGLGTTDAATDLLNLEYKYDTTTSSHDNNGSMMEQKITVPAVGNNAAFTAIQTYTYDALNRLGSATEIVSTTQTWKQEFSYDRYGNKNFVTGPGHTTTLGTCPTAECNPSFETGRNRFSGGQGYSYDANGNITEDATDQRYSYDAENHQKEFFSETNSGSTPDATYVYDGDGRRVKKVHGGEITIFVYDALGRSIAEYATTITSPEDAAVSYMTQDHLGSPRIITDRDGDVTSRKDFAAFGDEVVSAQRVIGPEGNGYSPPDIRKDYTGYEKDLESGLEFAQARYYNTQHGRFTSVDPLTASASIRDPQTFNRYTYVLNSPYKFTDPLGLLPDGYRDFIGTCSAEHGSCTDDSELGGWMVRESETQEAAGPPAVNGTTGSSENPQAQQPQPPPGTTNYPANPNAPAPGTTEFFAPTFAELDALAANNNPGAQAALTILGSNAEAAYNNFTIYERAVFVNTTAAIADAKLNLTGVSFGGFYSGNKSRSPFGIVLDGVTNQALDKAGLTEGVGGRRSPGDIQIASLEASTIKRSKVKGGRNSVAFDVDLYNVRSRPFSHWREVSFNRSHGFTTQPADVARALVARGVTTGVRTR